ncbi:DNA cross-link repair protein-like protein [Hapsidospora chrysogenum ATCC 11550]|uniref:DNA cross-link repair protein-like protein n=1 Tax=Hapsidospora chrysogenum (strain ATCC 11550 / CBS 779.69 / DSM 880 / IAM 14645 / JCM 23072 / IMI 49137) TaxID=857340 RepID=A0A086TF80_HAPC1|nr:DNA cross-link repair protein-like protein [Hapsidospora chrysogenum ATCC 11550]
MGAPTKTRRTTAPKKQTTLSASSFARGTPKPTKPSRPNSSILSFFKKTERPGDSLFVGPAPDAAIHDDHDAADDLFGDGDHQEPRFNEILSPVKKRRVSAEVGVSSVHNGVVSEDPDIPAVVAEQPATPAKSGKRRIQGPFLMDSDSEDEDPAPRERANPPNNVKDDQVGEEEGKLPMFDQVGVSRPERAVSDRPYPPPLEHQDSSCVPDSGFGEFGELGDLGDGDLDMFEGEETREMRFMREQARLEAAEADALEGGFSSEDFVDDTTDDGSMNRRCPICQGSIADLSPDEATRHVNLCLDGDAPPLPKPEATTEMLADSNAAEVDSSAVSKRFARKNIPRPPQFNPLEAGPSTAAGGKSAFSKLMSNTAEDSAWATAAATEKSSRGRPAYERTCPFYKIMPGFAICVDAFRYGAIEGCKAYFLSHFHSDHYIGLTARWSHGPIYCSKVTGSLVRKQLGTADKWVVDLDFEKPYDIPGTDGATVTMIPANHCPGSSLFLFQKPTSKSPNSPVKRILHCGDFRACPAHVEHPLLRPELKDSVSGKIRQQKIDICYLDTTYLNPRYSFPPQDDVIKACADMCASMSPDPSCKDDIWERSANGIGTPAVSKYFQKDHSNEGRTATDHQDGPKQRLLVVCGTYSIGKERICVAIAKALNSKIFASPGKIKICRQLDMPELTELLTPDPLEAQVHMQSLMEIRSETLQEYLNGYKPHFSRIVGFRPSGWNYRPSNGKAVGANVSPGTVPTQQILHGKAWRSRFGYKDFVPQRGSTAEAMCFGVPYSEHSSFRELAMFLMGLRIEKVVPTVNVGSEQSRARMKAWTDKWVAERRKYGLMQPLVEDREDEDRGQDLWEGKPGKGGGAWW